MSTKKIKTKKLEQTEIVVVLDRSGSMGSIKDATVEGFNTFLNEQKNAEGEAFITLVQFDDRYEMNYQSVPVSEAQPLIAGETFVPRGTTALYDAIGKTINDLKTDRDVIFVIITDGHENASQEFRGEAIKKMIESLTNEEGWKFIFLAANQDAMLSGNSIGISGANSMTYVANDASTSAAFFSVSSNMASYRSSKFKNLSDDEIVSIKNLSKDLEFKDEQRKDSNKS
jgi:uncharacterized protein with von Willebrand factor type A (vWA) domain